ncbi:MAG: PTS sugar transporter subunit IIC [Elusimicrobiota bacterium]|jgi:PTS system mannose-specific IIC component|nr:PTS sugar transporter subunit IIC [Elusimicrobiota bacterium]
MMIENILLLSLIAAIFSADMTCFGQFMICRPIFCAPIFGYLTGDVASGLWVGMIVEMIWFNAVPLGASMPPDICAISILSVVWTNRYFPGLSSACIFALIAATPFGYICREIDAAGRRINVKIMYWIEEGINKTDFNRLNTGIFLGLFLFIFKFFIFYILVIPLGGIIFSVYLMFPPFVLNGFTKAWFHLPILGFGTVAYSFVNLKIKMFR